MQETIYIISMKNSCFRIISGRMHLMCFVIFEMKNIYAEAMEWKEKMNRDK